MILCVGEALIDMVPIPHGEETAYLPRPGGSPYNVAVALGRLGAQVGFLGRISRDPFGLLLRQQLERSGVSLKYIVDTEDMTYLALVQVVTKVAPRFTFYRQCDGTYFLAEEEVPPTLDGVDIVHFGSISLLVEPGATAISKLIAREAGQRLISFDPNVRPVLIKDRDAYMRRFHEWVEWTDVLKLSREDVDWLYPGESMESVADQWLQRGVSLVVITLGEKGAVAFTPRTIARVHAPQVDVVDTVGAGDAFTAALLLSLCTQNLTSPDAVRSVSNHTLTSILTFAVRVGALTCTRAGAEPPWRDEVADVTG